MGVLPVLRIGQVTAPQEETAVEPLGEQHHLLATRNRGQEASQLAELSGPADDAPAVVAACLPLDVLGDDLVVLGRDLLNLLAQVGAIPNLCPRSDPAPSRA